MRAMILAAGFGTRLGALSDERPKPLLPVCDHPILRYGLALLAGEGYAEAVINLHHRGDLIERELSDPPAPLALTWSREERILGTGGGIRRVADWLTRGDRESFLILNGKLVIDVDLGALARRHREREAIATMVVREVPDAERWGAIDLDEDDRVVGILGERAPNAKPTARRTMFTGVHLLTPALTARLPPVTTTSGESCVIRQGYLPALRAGEPIHALRYDGYFQEHSTAARYLEGNLAVLRGEARLRFPPGSVRGVDPSARVAEGAILVEPVRIGPHAEVGPGAVVGPGVVIGHHAVVSAGARLERAVVWPGAVADGVIADAIVTPRGVFPAHP